MKKLLLLLLILTACSAENTLKIGAVLPLSGEGASYGDSAMKAIEIAVQKVNEQGGINGKELEVIYQDDQMKANLAATSFSYLVNIQGIKHVIGFGSGETLAMCPMAEKKNIILFSSGSGMAVTECKNTYRNYPSDFFQGKLLAEKAMQEGYEKPYILYTTTEYSTGLAKVIKEIFEENNQEFESSSYKNYENDFRTIIEKIKDSGADAVIFLPKVPVETMSFLKQRVELGLSIPVIGSETLKNKDLMTQLTEKEREGVVTNFVSESKGKARKEFLRKYRERYGEDPAPYADYVHDNALFLIEVLGQCEFEDVECQKEKLETMTVNGATGLIDFNEEGDVTSAEYSFYKFGKDDFEVVEP